MMQLFKETKAFLSVAQFHSSLQKLQSEVVNLLTDSGVSHSELTEGLAAEDKARVDIVSAFAINSLVWLLLKSKGQDPKETEVRSSSRKLRFEKLHHFGTRSRWSWIGSRPPSRN